MRWDAVLVDVAALLALLQVALPMYAALRIPAFSWGQAALLLGLSVLADVLLALVFMLLFQVLADLFPALNPFGPPAYESVDAGIFALYVGVTAALAAVCLGQYLRIRASRRGPPVQEKEGA